MQDLAQLRSAGLFDARVPRYTSYPAASRFTSAIGEADMAAWLSAIPEGTQVSAYVHIPFCRELCWFCACRTQGTQSLAPLTAYLATLRAELALVAASLPPGVTLSRLHWGGGTPTLLPAGMIGELAAAVAEVLPLAPGAEFSVEIDPGEIDAERLDALARAGMNRASIGVQDFHPEVQAAIGRRQSLERTREVADMLRARGIGSLNADILFGLPHQSLARIRDSVSQLLTLGPDRVALYGYAHVPWMARRQVLIDETALPGGEERLALFEAARALFLAAGYAEIGIDHFARPADGLAEALREGRLKRNFQGYTDDRSGVLLGLGASAISKFPQGYAQNASATAAHATAIRAGRFATARGHAFVGYDRLRGRMIEALLCDFAIDAGAVAGETDVPVAAVEALLAGLQDRFPEVLLRAGTGLAIRPEARPLARLMARELDAYEAPAGAHSPAI